MPTVDDTLKALRERRSVADVGLLFEARQLAGAARASAISVENLTRDPDWDRFLGMLQAALEGAEASKRALLDQLANPEVPEIEAHRIRALAGVAATRAHTLRHIIALPADLKRDGEKARSLLERLEEKADAAA